MTLRARLILLILLAAVPVFLIHIITDYEIREARKSTVVGSAETLARLIAARQDRIVEGARLLLEASSHLQSVREKNSEACNRSLRDIAAKVQELTAMAVLTPQGERWCLSIPAGGGLNLADRQYFQNTVKTGMMQSSDFIIGRQTGQGSLVFTYPAFNAAGALDSVMFVAYRTSVLSRLLNDPPLPEGAIVALLDSQGVITARWPDPEKWMGNNLSDSEVARRAISQRHGSMRTTSDRAGQGEFAFAFAPMQLPSKLTVLVGLPMTAVLAEANALFWREVVWTTLVFLIAALLAIWGTQVLVVRPLRALHQSLDSLARGDHDTHMPSSGRGITELRALSDHFEKMAAALRERQSQLLQALQQKEILLKEVNHRVKNSLQLVASLFGLQRTSIKDPEARRQFELAGQRINTVAQIHQRLYQDENVDRVSLDRFLKEMCADLQKMLGDNSKLSLVCEAGPCHLPTEQVIPVALITNELITNAIKYSYPVEPGGVIRVLCEREHGAIVLTVSDDGAPLPENFDAAGSNGLGMRMITALTKQLRAKIEVVRQPRGKAFVLRVPSSEN